MDERDRIGTYEVIVEECKGPNRNKKYVKESWRQDGDLHRVDGPAIFIKDLKGNVVLSEWYQYGQLHREDGEPASFADDGAKRTEVWASLGEPHRNKGPARLVTDLASEVIVEEEYYWCGHEHRDNGPARITRSSTTGTVTSEHWKFLGKSNRHNGPSFIERDEQTGKTLVEQWRKKDKLHREEGPAVIYYSPEDGSVLTSRFYNDGKRVPSGQLETLTLDT